MKFHLLPVILLALLMCSVVCNAQTIPKPPDLETKEEEVPEGSCSGAISGLVQHIGPEGRYVLPVGEDTVEVEFFSIADTLNASTSDIQVMQSAVVNRAIRTPLSNGNYTYTKGEELSRIELGRHLSDCTSLTNWKIAKEHNYTTGSFYSTGTIFLVAGDDVNVILDSEFELFHVAPALGGLAF